MGEAYDHKLHEHRCQIFEEAIAWHQTSEARKLYGNDNAGVLAEWRRLYRTYMDDYERESK